MNEGYTKPAGTAAFIHGKLVVVAARERITYIPFVLFFYDFIFPVRFHSLPASIVCLAVDAFSPHKCTAGNIYGNTVTGMAAYISDLVSIEMLVRCETTSEGRPTEAAYISLYAEHCTVSGTETLHNLGDMFKYQAF